MNLQRNRIIFSVYLMAFCLVTFQPLTARAEEALTRADVNRMTLRGFIQQVAQKHEEILIQQLGFRISQEAIQNERSVFEPEYTAAYQRSRQKTKRSQLDNPYLLFNPETDEVSEACNLAVAGKIPTGAVMRFGCSMENARDMAVEESQEQYKSFLGLEVSQPLLKGAGMAATANISLAQADSDVAFQEYRQKMLQVILNAGAGCWDYYRARQMLEIRKNSVKIARQILKENQERARLGKMADTEVLEAEAGLAKRKSLESKAMQDLAQTINTLRSYLSSSDVETGIEIEFGEYLAGDNGKPDFTTSIQRAFRHRPEYLSARRKIERENIAVSYAKNQRWPQLDLQGSYGLNSLSDTLGNSWEDMYGQSYRSWTVGATLTVPLLGGMKTRSELASARYRKRQALLELKSVEVNLAAMVNTAIQNVYRTREQLEYYKNVEKCNQRLLDVEMAMLEAGRSNSRDVLDKEEDLIAAREAEIESLADNKKASLMLDTAEGVLLTKFGIEIMELNDEKPLPKK